MSGGQRSETLGLQCREDGVGMRRVDRLRTEQHPGIWHTGGLESDGVKGKGVG